ncbi:hypothetical protein IJ818_01965 [bacterium]|nr:hypothetical protein [bacterium]
MKDKKPEFVYIFDNSKPAKEEQIKAICDLALLLFQIDKENKEKDKKF